VLLALHPSEALKASSQGLFFLTYVVASEVVDIGLGQHSVVLELRLAEGRSVGRNDDQLGLASAKGLEGGLVAESDCMLSVIRRWSREGILVPLPDFKTSARRALIELASRLDFLGAIASFVEMRCERSEVLQDGRKSFVDLRKVRSRQERSPHLGRTS
jgi:hypothetical protein